MGFQRPTAILRTIYVSAILLGSVMFGYGLQNQTPDQKTTPTAGQSPAAGESQDAAAQEDRETPASPTTQPQAETKASGQPDSNTRAAAKSETASISVRNSSPRPRVAVAVGFGGGFARFPRRTFVRPFVGFGFYPYGYYSPYYYPYYGPYYGPYYSPAYGYGYGYNQGEVKLSVEPKYARVYVNGAFAGRAEDLKNLHLKPGTYDLSLSAPGRASYQERIYVLGGKTLRIKVALEAEAGKPPVPAHTEEK